MEGHSRENGTMDRFRDWLQDSSAYFYGVGLVGIWTVVGEGTGLQGFQGHALLDGMYYSSK